MVLLHVKRGEESLFLFSCKVTDPVDSVLGKIVSIYNGRRKVLRLAEEVKDLAKHGVMMKAELQGLHPDQVKELKLVDEDEERCEPSGGDLKDVLIKAADEAKQKVHRDNVKAGVEVGEKTVRECLDLISGAVTIVWPMGLPHHDTVRLELENCEDLSGTQESKLVIDPQRANMWFANKEMLRGKLLKDYLGGNDKTKVVVKLSTVGAGPPVREPFLSEDQRKHLMLMEHRRREEIKKLMEDNDDQYLDQDWADNRQLAQSLRGVNQINWKP